MKRLGEKGAVTAPLCQLQLRRRVLRRPLDVAHRNESTHGNPVESNIVSLRLEFTDSLAKFDG